MERMSDSRDAMGETGDGPLIELVLSATEIALLRTGLEMLEDTFGHEEAEVLEEVQALLAKLPHADRPVGG